MTNRSNGYGDYHTTCAADMAAQDDLPPPLRHAVNYAVSSIASEPLLRDWRDAQLAGLPGRAIIRAAVNTIRRIDATETVKTYDPGHPEAGNSHD